MGLLFVRKLVACKKTRRTLQMPPKSRSLTRKLPTSHCSPARYCLHKRTGTCLQADEIIPVLKANGVVPPATASALQLATLIRSTAAHRAKTEQVLAEHAVTTTRDASLRRKIGQAYRPFAPASWSDVKSSRWLSSDDIESVMRQYEYRPEFKFLGVSPIDFADRPTIYGGRCVSPAMCSLDVAGLVRAGLTTHLGVVLNMDKHDAVGSHWVAIYVGLDPAKTNFGAFYYDSVASPPVARVSAWMQGIAQAMNRKSTTRPPGLFKVAHNTVRRQFGQSECGIFSMMFLIHCVQRRSSFRQICKVLGGDDAMRATRSVLFRPAQATGVVLQAAPMRR